MKTPIEQLTTRLRQLEGEKESYEEQLSKATSDITSLNNYITTISGNIKNQKEAIAKLQDKEPLVLNISEMVKRDFLCKGEIYRAMQNALRD
jgi:flagellar biosynthesis chaperone FliJ